MKMVNQFLVLLKIKKVEYIQNLKISKDNKEQLYKYIKYEY